MGRRKKILEQKRNLSSVSEIEIVICETDTGKSNF